MQLIPDTSIRGWVVLSGARVPNAVSTVCPHCREKGVFTLSGLRDDPNILTISSPAKCPGCNKLVMFWAIRAEKQPKSNDKNPEAVYMYPPAKNYMPMSEFQVDIPPALKKAFISTIDAYNSTNYAATAVCARRTLEGIFKHLVPEDKRTLSLQKLIEHVKDNTDLAAPLTSLSHAIRDGGNLGAHFDMEKEPDQHLAKHMVELLDYLISYLYVLPKEIKKLEDSLGKCS